jgi:hypothetical protein
VNNEVLTVIGTGYITAEGFDSSGLRWEMAFTERTDLYDDDIIPSVMLCAGVPDGGEAKRSGLFGKAESAEQEVSDRSCLVVF